MNTVSLRRRRGDPWYYSLPICIAMVTMVLVFVLAVLAGAFQAPREQRSSSTAVSTTAVVLFGILAPCLYRRSATT